MQAEYMMKYVIKSVICTVLLLSGCTTLVFDSTSSDSELAMVVLYRPVSDEIPERSALFLWDEKPVATLAAGYFTVFTTKSGQHTVSHSWPHWFMDSPDMQDELSMTVNVKANQVNYIRMDNSTFLDGNWLTLKTEINRQTVEEAKPAIAGCQYQVASKYVPQ
ncbi:hypothetical protein [Zooshikella ganghwensis]|uniref:hypothetical protein n=1 Tax=Zooshikella ganghwensis TaxID=202772 RepID=UPI0012FCFDE8|nr:hypothetical protein [Zooshikella ganghwensis]